LAVEPTAKENGWVGGVKGALDMPGQEPESDPVLKLRPRKLFWRGHLGGILEATGDRTPRAGAF